MTVSLHNTYRDKNRGFKINENCVRILEVRHAINPRGDLIDERFYHPIYSFNRIIEKLNTVPDIV